MRIVLATREAQKANGEKVDVIVSGHLVPSTATRKAYFREFYITVYPIWHRWTPLAFPISGDSWRGISGLVAALRNHILLAPLFSESDIAEIKNLIAEYKAGSVEGGAV